MTESHIQECRYPSAEALFDEVTKLLANYGYSSVSVRITGTNGRKLRIKATRK